MFQNRIAIGRNLLITLIALLSFSFANPPVVEANQKKNTQIVKLQEKVDVPDTNVLRSGTEMTTSNFKVSFDFNYFSSESFYSNVLQVHLNYLQSNKERFQSAFKIYLQFLKLLI
jgi:outer membrane protein OmpA-like peptidoglycan-associated protein